MSAITDRNVAEPRSSGAETSTDHIADLGPMGLAGFVMAQLLAGMREFHKANMSGALAFCSFGAFWLSFATYANFVVTSSTFKKVVLPVMTLPRPERGGPMNDRAHKIHRTAARTEIMAETDTLSNLYTENRGFPSDPECAAQTVVAERLAARVDADREGFRAEQGHHRVDRHVQARDGGQVKVRRAANALAPSSLEVTR